MPDQPYLYRELNEKFEKIDKRFDDQDTALEKIDNKVSYTNGSVRRITLALVALGFLCIGLVAKDLSGAINLVASLK